LVLERLCVSSDVFIKLKNKFIRNYATLCIASYILGIGDRHLENFLLNNVNGEIISIDFGYSFGSGVGLSIPELMPFRLTRIFESLLEPVGTNGIFRYSMIYALTALRNKKNLLLTCCDVFIKDPLIEWIRLAKKYTNIY